MSRKKRPEDPAILVAWRVQVHRLEEEIKLLKGALGRKQPLKVLRKMRHRHRQCVLQLQVLYEVRVMGKRVSYGRWSSRHARYPEGPPNGKEQPAEEQLSLLGTRRMVGADRAVIEDRRTIISVPESQEEVKS